jgi:hypothetical protein
MFDSNESLGKLVVMVYGIGVQLKERAPIAENLQNQYLIDASSLC